jgi:hypothetical protein
VKPGVHPTAEPIVVRYLQLGLQVGRHVEGIVDAYFGPPGLAADVERAPLVEPSRLVAEAEDLLGAAGDGWLRDQLGGLRTYAGMLAGELRPYADEVEGCFGVRPTYVDEAVFAAAHEELDALLPGSGTVSDRHRRWEESIRMPPERIEPTIAAVIETARSCTRRFVELPAGEGVELEIVRDVPWLGFCEYLGGLRSRISVNVTLPMSALELLVLAIHETYPGHHVERCCKEEALVRGRRLLEETLVLVPTPQSLVSEGIAALAPDLVLDGDAGAALAGVIHDAGVDFDLGQAVAVQRALAPCRWAEVNGALLLHDEGRTEAEVQCYLERWGLMTPELAAHVVRFYAEPTSRTYIVNYAAGRRLCGAYVAGDPERFARLLTEQVRVRDLLDAADAAVPGRSG